MICRALAAAILMLTPVACPAGDFPLPPRDLFPRAMPRYPNLWFFVERALAPSYEAAVRLVGAELRQDLELRENHGRMSNPEGSDFEATVEGLQPWRAPDASLAHGHAFHIRYYFQPLKKNGAHQVEIRGVRYYRIAASAHYEVEHASPLHPDVESCGVCGRTGWYSSERGNLVERVHDPLGLELATMGKIREERVPLPSGRPSSGICNVQETFVPTEPQMNTQRIAIVVLRRGWQQEKIKCVRDDD